MSGKRGAKIALRIALIYSLVSVLWIFTSDYLSALYSSNSDALINIQVIKGIFFVLATGALIYYLIYREVKKQQNLIQILNKENQLHSALLKNMPDVDAFLFDPDKEVLYYQGSEIEKISIEPETPYGITKMQEIPLDKYAVEEIVKSCDEILEGKNINNDINYLGNYYELRGTPLYDDEQNIYAGVLLLVNNTSQTKLIRDLNERMMEYESLYEEYLSQSESLKRNFDELQNTNIKLTESEKKYRTYLDQSTNGVYHFRLNRPVDIHLPVEDQVKTILKETELVECNDKFVEMYGANSKQEITGKRLLDFYGGDEVENWDLNKLFVENKYRLFNKESIEFKKDGSKVYFNNNTLGVVENEHLVMIWGTQSDHTKQKMYEQELLAAKEQAQRNEQKYIDLFNNLNDGVLLYDLDQDYLPNKTYEANEEICRILKVDRQQLIGGKITDFLDASQHMLARERGKKHQDGEGLKFEVLLVNSQGDKILVEAKTSIVNYDNKKLILAIIRDITERKEAEKEIRDSYTFVENMINSFSDGIAVFNKSLKCTYWNKAMDNISSKTALESVGKKDSLGIPGLSDKSVIKYFQQAFSGKISRTKDFETKHHPRNASWYYASFVPNRDSHGNIIGVIVILSNISARKKMELDLEKERDNAQKSDHLKSAFLANMSHEIRTPMNSIIGFSEMLDDYDVTEDERHQYSGIIRSNSNNLLRIIDDILNIAKIETKQVAYYYSTFALNNLINEVAMHLEHLIDKKDKDVKVIRNKGLEDAEDLIYSDKERLYQVLINLITNAEKFTEQGKITIEYHPEGDKLWFSITDTGVGIAPEAQHQIFERFRQGTDEYNTRKYGGTGLGLPIAKGILKGMQGEIMVESAVGEGSRFQFYIPYHKDAPNHKK